MQHQDLRSYIMMAMFAAMGIAVKGVVAPLVHMITGPLLIPGGVVAGGVYMSFIILSRAITERPFAAVTTSFIQALIVMVVGSFGSHGILSIITYCVPGLVIDGVFKAFGRVSDRLIICCLAGVGANLAGTALVNITLFKLPLWSQVLPLSAATLSGAIGGIVSAKVVEKLQALGMVGK